MKVVVAAASRHGATAEIAAAIAATLTDRGIEATLSDPAALSDLAPFDAFVVGSAIYMGRWLEPAAQLVGRLASEARARPVWLFSSGPLGTPLKPDGDPPGVAQLVESTRARGHRVFPGRIARSELGLAERAVVKMLRAPQADQRDWPEIQRWASDIADELQPAAGALR